MFYHLHLPKHGHLHAEVPGYLFQASATCLTKPGNLPNWVRECPSPLAQPASAPSSCGSMAPISPPLCCLVCARHLVWASSVLGLGFHHNLLLGSRSQSPSWIKVRLLSVAVKAYCELKGLCSISPAWKVLTHLLHLDSTLPSRFTGYFSKALSGTLTCPSLILPENWSLSPWSSPGPPGLRSEFHLSIYHTVLYLFSFIFFFMRFEFLEVWGKLS